MSLKRKNGAMGAKRKQIASSSDDEKNQFGIPIEGDEDDKPLFGVCPRPEKVPVAKVDRSQVRETITGGWRLVLLDGQYVGVKLTREEKLLIRGERVPETSDSQDEDSEHEPDYLLSDEEGLTSTVWRMVLWEICNYGATVCVE
jgi:hypothetical protein